MSKLEFISLAQLEREDTRLWVSVSSCAGSQWFIERFGPKDITRYGYAKREEAYKAKAMIDQMGCGGGCKEWHAVEVALPHERCRQHQSISRRRYATYGAVIPEAFLLPKERAARERAKAKPIEASPRPRAGHVYLIHAVGSNRIKIGRSVAKDVRFDHLKAASPYPLILLRAIVTAEMATLERVLHLRYAQYRQLDMLPAVNDGDSGDQLPVPVTLCAARREVVGLVFAQINPPNKGDFTAIASPTSVSPQDSCFSQAFNVSVCPTATQKAYLVFCNLCKGKGCCRSLAATFLPLRPERRSSQKRGF